LQESLLRVFADAGEMDFTQGTLAALKALGDGDAPSELLLRLDLAVDHILVDEFQDTSFAHLDLLRRLMAGWTEGDGRTIFAVGDPMQSIYRFRGAEVRAFVDAQASNAIEGIAVEPLTLRRNFRSQAGLVEWANATFPGVLGDINDAWGSRVAFADAVPARDAVDAEPCTVDFAENPADEARRVVAHVRDALAVGRDVAILVRARSHLVKILPALRLAGIAYAAVELDALAERSAVRDVVALAHALVQSGDRLAWLAVLRAPWCGLTLDDLHAIVVAAEATDQSIEALVHVPPETLSDDARARLARVAPVLAAASASRSMLAERVADAWRALGGPSTLDDPLDLVAVDDTIALIAAHERAGDVDDWNALVSRLAGERASPEGGAHARVQVMTMFKAKGLEFDVVVLPGLAHARTKSDTPFLRWRTRRHGLMLGLAKPRGGEHDGVYAYLKALADEEDRVELGRIAYVACTRAKHRLALVAAIKRQTNRKTGEIAWVRPKPPALYGVLGAPCFDTLPPPAPGDEVPSAAIVPPRLARLPAHWRPPTPIAPLTTLLSARATEVAPPFDWARERSRRLGVVVHLMLAQIADEGVARWDDARLAAIGPRVEAALVGEGALPFEAAAEAADVRATLATTLSDPRGRWLFDPSHDDARSEWALTGVDAGDMVHVVLDRTFVADGERWIVDFKTGTHQGADATGFLDAEVERYRPQLERYKRIVAALDPGRPIRLALYHPRVAGGWREVT
jgi:superfamily I DNA/RNA helicase